MKLPINEIICGAMPEATKGFPNGSVNCCISSPPYWALRDYGVDGQLGLEPTFEEYIDKLCTIYDEVFRILRPDGTIFVNLGDTYWGGKGQSGQGSPEYQEARQDVSINKPASHVGGQKLTRPQDMQHDTIQAKSLCLIPQRFAIEMVNRGWILRNVIIWHKPNPMPSSAKDRFTVDFELVYFFVKSRKYWFEPQYEPHKDNYDLYQKKRGQNLKYEECNTGANHLSRDSFNPLGRNKRTVWTIPTQPFPEAHFATFPEKLVEPMIRSGCPEFVCTKCGKAREKIYDRQIPPEEAMTSNKQTDDKLVKTSANRYGKGQGQKLQNWLNEHPPTFKGYTDCKCNADWRPGIVWDCFLWLWHDLTGGRKVAT